MENNGLNAPDDRLRLVNRDIAFASDLLALHAATEAACGGADGRDFARAAGELRRLANGAL